MYVVLQCTNIIDMHVSYLNNFITFFTTQAYYTLIQKYFLHIVLIKNIMQYTTYKR